MGRQYKFSKSAILARVRQGPVKLLELAQGSRNPEVRKRLMRHVHAMERAGTIKKQWINGFPHYTLPKDAITDDDRVRMLRENCRKVDGCLAWASHVDPQRGPIGRVDGPPLNVRRFIWRVTRQVLAERYGVSRSLIGMVLRHEVWVEAGGMFTGLMRVAAA